MSPSWCEELLVVTLIFSECIPTNMWTGTGVAWQLWPELLLGQQGLSQCGWACTIPYIFTFPWFSSGTSLIVPGFWGAMLSLQFSHKKPTSQNAWDIFFHDVAFNRLTSGASPQGIPWSPQSQWLASAVLYWPQYKHGPSKTETTDNALMFVTPAAQKWSAARWELFGFHSSSGVLCFAVVVVVWWGTILNATGSTKGPLCLCHAL